MLNNASQASTRIHLDDLGNIQISIILYNSYRLTNVVKIPFICREYADAYYDSVKGNTNNNK